MDKWNENGVQKVALLPGAESRMEPYEQRQAIFVTKTFCKKYQLPTEVMKLASKTTLSGREKFGFYDSDRFVLVECVPRLEKAMYDQIMQSPAIGQALASGMTRQKFTTHLSEINKETHPELSKCIEKAKRAAIASGRI